MKRLSLLSVSLACFSILSSCEQEEYELTENSNILNYPVASTRTIARAINAAIFTIIFVLIFLLIAF